MVRRLATSLLVFLCVTISPSVRAEDIGYAEALGALSVSCRQDISKLCPQANLGGGQVAECLEHNWAKVSGECKSANKISRDLLVKRRNARRSVPAKCDLDRMRLCSGIQPGDANLMECFSKTKSNVSSACRQAIRDAGYEVSLATGPITNQIHLSSGDLLSSLEGAETLANIDATQLRKIAAEGMRDPRRASRVNRPPVFEHLNNLAQLTIAMQFDFNSARVNPSSYRAVGLIADALYHPHLQGYCFLVIGHTDAVGSREYNFNLSQQRADAVRSALINPFGIDERRIAAVGLGEEQLMDAAHPESSENRRVQLINVGKLPGNPACEDKPPEEIK